MKFLSHLGSCFRPTVVDAVVQEEEGPTTASNSNVDGIANQPSRIRLNNNGTGGSTAHWRPALSTISENCVASFGEGRFENKATKPKKNPSNKGFASVIEVARGIFARTDNDIYFHRNNTMQTGTQGLGFYHSMF